MAEASHDSRPGPPPSRSDGALARLRWSLNMDTAPPADTSLKLQGLRPSRSSAFLSTRERAKRISSLFTLSTSSSSSSRSDPNRVSSSQSPKGRESQVSSPLQSEPDMSSPTVTMLAPPPSPFHERRASSPGRRGRTASPFSTEARRSWRSRSRGQSPARSRSDRGPDFWIWAGEGRIQYDPAPLVRAQKVPELWNEPGDTFVYLHPKSFNKPPSFKVHSSLYSNSPVLRSLAFGDFFNPPTRRNGSLELPTRKARLGVPGTEPSSPSSPEGDDDHSPASRAATPPELSVKEAHLYFPLSRPSNGPIHPAASHEPPPSPDDVEELMAVRNLFAFLARQPLVASKRHQTYFSILQRISHDLERLRFSNLDGTSFGEVPAASFDAHIEMLEIGDCRVSCEKTIEALVLGERMKCVELYNEAFVHAVGKYEALKTLGSPSFQLISALTRNRMERSHMDLETRIKSVSTRLTDFDFPSLFSGIANSTTSDESKFIRFKAWKSALTAFRKWVMTYYKIKFGSWPPKSSSKKNNLHVSGLNRVVLQTLYQDMSDLYDLLVDRTNLATRVADLPSEEGVDNVEADEPKPKALRRILDEYDRSSPPVQPRVPFDTPRLPVGRSGTLSLNPKKERKEQMRKLKSDETDKILTASYNQDANKATPFLAGFRAFERKAAHDKTLHDMCDLRNGQWIFLYAVIQSLPMLAIDAPDLKWTEGVEYFLCQIPKGGVPWGREHTRRKKSWYGINGGSGLVSLPPDVVDHGVEGIYSRSHCWTVAARWEAELSPPALVAPPAIVTPDDTAPSLDPSSSSPYTSPIDSPPTSPPGPGLVPNFSKRISAVKLQQLPLPAGIDPAVEPVPKISDRPGLSRSFTEIIHEGRPDRSKQKKKRIIS